MMDDKDLSHSESFEIITKMINQAKNNYYESGMGALLWGFTNVICFTLAYLDNAIEGFDLPFNPFLLMIITMAVQIYLHRKESRFKQATTYLDEAHKYVWMAFGISVLIVSIAGGIGKLNYYTLPVLLTLFAIPTFITGSINKFKPLIFGGVVCWIFSIVTFLHKSDLSFLFVAAGAFAAWVVPGFILRARFNKQRNRADGL
jgi:hypothetical protein